MSSPIVVDFQVPALSQNLRDLELDGGDGGDVKGGAGVQRLRAINVRDIHEENAKAQVNEVDILAEQLNESGSASELVCLNQEWFDALFSFTRFAVKLTKEARALTIVRLLCPLVRRVVGEVEQLEPDDASEAEVACVRSAYKVSVYLLAKVCVEEERRVARDGDVNDDGAKGMQKRKTKDLDDSDGCGSGRDFDSENETTAAGVSSWKSLRLDVLNTLLGAILPSWNKRTPMSSSSRCAGDNSNSATREFVDFGKLWSCALPEEAFLDLFWRTAESLVLDNPKLASGLGVTNEMERRCLIELVCAPVHQFHGSISHLVAASLSHSLGKHEGIPTFTTGVLVRLAHEYKDERLAREMILEVGRIDTQEASRDSAGMKLLGAFVESISSELSALVLANLSVLVPHLGAHAYPLRCSIVRSLGLLVVHLKETEEQQLESKRDEGKNNDEQTDGCDNSQYTEDSSDKGVTEVSSTKATRDQLLDLIGERTHDSSSYVRAVSLSTLAELSRFSALPLSHMHVACDIARERLLDKSSLVRKQAIACLTTLLENNPYNDRLDPVYFREKVLELEASMPKKPETTEVKDDDLKDDDGDVVDSDADIEEGADGKPGADSEENAAAEQERQTLNPKATVALSYFRAALGFAARMEHACMRAELLTTSKSVTDVLESMRFLSAAVRFKLPAAQGSMRRMLALVWDDRESGRVKKELLETFEIMYVSEPVTVSGGGLRGNTKRKLYPEQDVADSLVDIVLHATLSELTSLEKIVAELVSTDGMLKRLALPSVVVGKVWMTVQDCDAELRRRQAAMCLISMVASTSSNLLDRFKFNSQALLDSVVAQTKDYQLARHAFATMIRVLGPNSKTSRARASEALAASVVKVVGELMLCEAGWETTNEAMDSNRWFPAAEQGLQLLVRCSERPDLACASLVRRLHKKLFGYEEATGARKEKCSEVALAQLFFVVGHVAIQLYVYAEETSSLAKRLRKGRVQDLAEKGVGKSAAEKEELAMLGSDEATEDDFEESVLKRITDHELVGNPSETLLGLYVPLMAAVVKRGLKQQQRQQDGDVEVHGDGAKVIGDVLLESATLALCKACCISQVVCEQHLRLLLTVLRDSRDANVRSNIMIAMGDLAVRFPNTVEPFTAQVYRRLRDLDTSVRKTSLMVLSHLILNDMIKVRGEVSELALCVEDEGNERIRDLAQLFFHELSRKGSNPVYNLLPDALAKLSRDPSVEEAKFQSLAMFLTNFIVLDKHVLSITDKLCQRIFAATGLTQGAEELESVADLPNLQLCRDLAFSLAQLKPSDGMVKKLADDALFKLYKPVLADNHIYDSLQAYVKRVRQFSKPETKLLVDEWVAKMETVRMAHIDNQASNNKAKKMSSMTAAKAKTKTTKVTKSKAMRSSSRKVLEKLDENAESEEEPEEQTLAKDLPSAKRSTRATRSRGNKENVGVV